MKWYADWTKEKWNKAVKERKKEIDDADIFEEFDSIIKECELINE